jgi:hypothetical protein
LPAPQHVVNHNSRFSAAGHRPPKRHNLDRAIAAQPDHLVRGGIDPITIDKGDRLVAAVGYACVCPPWHRSGCHFVTAKYRLHRLAKRAHQIQIATPNNGDQASKRRGGTGGRMDLETTKLVLCALVTSLRKSNRIDDADCQNIICALDKAGTKAKKRKHRQVAGRMDYLSAVLALECFGPNHPIYLSAQKKSESD